MYTLGNNSLKPHNCMKTETEKTKKTTEIPEIMKSTLCEFDTEGVNWTLRKFAQPQRTIRIATSFSGISAPDMALKRLGLKSRIVFASDIGERYLKYTFARLSMFAMELDVKYRDRFAEELYEGNRANVESLNEAKRKAGKKEIPFSFKNVYDCLFNGAKTLTGNYELAKGCIDIILENKGITERKKIEKYVSSLYDEKGVNYVKEAFFANYEINEDDWHTDIRFMDATPYKGQVDLYVGGSPCQSYSRSGKRLTLEDTRGQLFYDFAVRIKECEPKVFIFENVADMTRANKKDEMSGLEAALSVFDSLRYKLFWNVLDACNYGVPQHRERVWVVGFRKDIDVDFKFPDSIPLKLSMYDFLEPDIYPRCGKVDTISERELTWSECLRLMGFRDFNVPSSIRELGNEKMTDKLRFMAGNSMVVECLMALYLQMDITKYGVDEIGDIKLKSSLYEYSDDELDELIRKVKSFRGSHRPSGEVDFGYLTASLLTDVEDELIKVGAHKHPKTGKGTDSQWDRVYSVRGICPTLTRSGHIYIIVSNETYTNPKPKWVEPVKRIPTSLW